MPPKDNIPQDYLMINQLVDYITNSDTGDIPSQYATDIRGIRLDRPGMLAVRDYGTKHRYASYPTGITIRKAYNFNVIDENKEYDILVGTDSSTNMRLFAGDGSKAITGATNATPIVITVASHGYSTNDTVIVVGVLGNTAANGTFTITKIDDNSFSLNGSVGNGAYTSGTGSVSRWLELTEYITVTIDSVDDANRQCTVSAPKDILAASITRSLGVDYFLNQIAIVDSLSNPTGGLITASTAYSGAGTFTLTFVNKPTTALGWAAGNTLKIHRFTGVLPDSILGTNRGYAFSQGATPHVRILDIDAQAKLTMLYGDSSTPTTFRQPLQIRKSKYQTPSSFTVGGSSTGWALKTRISGNATVNGVTITGKAVKNATNATPIVITATAHGKSNGNSVYISGVLGNTAVNGKWTVANATADTFELSGSVGNGVWTPGTGIIERGWICQANGSTLYSDDGGDTWVNVTGVSVALRKIRFVEISKAITGATNATPIVISSASHGFSNGDTVRVKDVLGNTAANGLWEIANIAAGTYELVNSVGSGAYTSGGTGTKIDRTTGWCVGDANPTNAVVLRMTNGDVTSPSWTSVSTAALAGVNLYDISIVDHSNIFICGTNEKVFTTTNGTASPPTWTDKSPTVALLTPTITGVYAIDANTAWLCYADAGNTGAIYKTTNGGTSWTTQATFNNKAFAIKFYDANTGWCVADNGYVTKTTNGGTTWTQQTIPITVGISDIDIVSTSAVKASYRDSQNGVVGTSDGITWFQEYFPVTDGMYGIDLIDGTNGYAVGVNGTVVRLSGAVGVMGVGPSSGFYVDKAQLLPDSFTLGTRTVPRGSTFVGTSETKELAEGIQLKFTYQNETDTGNRNNMRMYGTLLYVGKDGTTPIQESDPVFQVFMGRIDASDNFISAQITVYLDLSRVNKSIYGMRFYCAIQDLIDIGNDITAWNDDPAHYRQAFQLTLATNGWTVDTANRYSHSITLNEFTIGKINEVLATASDTILTNLGHAPDMTRSYMSPGFIVRGSRGEEVIVCVAQNDKTARFSSFNGAGSQEDDNFPDVKVDNSARKQKSDLNGHGRVIGVASMRGNVYVFRSSGELEVFDFISGIPETIPCDFVAKESLVGVGLDDSPIGLAWAGESGLYVMGSDGSQIQLLNFRQKNLYDGSMLADDNITPLVSSVARAAVIGGYDSIYRELWFQLEVLKKDNIADSEFLQFRYNVETRKCNVRKLGIGAKGQANYFYSKVDKSFSIVYSSGILQYPMRSGLPYEDDVTFAGVTAGKGIETKIKFNCGELLSLAPRTIPIETILRYIGTSTNNNHFMVKFYANGEDNHFDMQEFRMNDIPPRMLLKPIGLMNQVEIEVSFPSANLTEYKLLELQAMDFGNTKRTFIGNN